MFLRKQLEAGRQAYVVYPLIDESDKLDVKAAAKEFEELTFQEIADVLELPLSTVKSRLYTALRQLQMRLQKFGE